MSDLGSSKERFDFRVENSTLKWDGLAEIGEREATAAEVIMWAEIERLQAREREAFRLANAATYLVAPKYALHAELKAFMDGQISKPEDYSGHEPCPGCAEFVRMQHDIASALGVDADTDSIDLHGRIYGAVSSAQPPALGHFKVLSICDAYESGYGSGLKAEGAPNTANPYATGTPEYEAYALGDSKGRETEREPCVSHIALGELEKLLRAMDEYLSRSPGEAIHAGSIFHQQIKDAVGPSPTKESAP